MSSCIYMYVYSGFGRRLYCTDIRFKLSEDKVDCENVGCEHEVDIHVYMSKV